MSDALGPIAAAVEVDQRELPLAFEAPWLLPVDSRWVAGRQHSCPEVGDDVEGGVGCRFVGVVGLGNLLNTQK